MTNEIILYENKTYCVYAHTNLINNKIYFGITSQKPEKDGIMEMGIVHINTFILRYKNMDGIIFLM